MAEAKSSDLGASAESGPQQGQRRKSTIKEDRAAALLAQLMDTGVQLEYEITPGKTELRTYTFVPELGALTAKPAAKPLAKAGHFITLRKFSFNATEAKCRLTVKTPNHQYILIVPNPATMRDWEEFLAMMQREQAQTDALSRVSSQLPSMASGSGPSSPSKPGSKDEERKAYWVPHDEGQYCARCGQAFSSTRWRHTCRDCGFLFCAAQPCFIDKIKKCVNCNSNIPTHRQAEAPSLIDSVVSVTDSSALRTVAPLPKENPSGTSASGQAVPANTVVLDQAAASAAAAKLSSLSQGEIDAALKANNVPPMFAPLVSALVQQMGSEAAAGLQGAAARSPTDAQAARTPQFTGEEQPAVSTAAATSPQEASSPTTAVTAAAPTPAAVPTPTPISAPTTAPAPAVVTALAPAAASAPVSAPVVAPTSIPPAESTVVSRAPQAAGSTSVPAAAGVVAPTPAPAPVPVPVPVPRKTTTAPTAQNPVLTRLEQHERVEQLTVRKSQSEHVDVIVYGLLICGLVAWLYQQFM